jgi:hypothetical protein
MKIPENPPTPPEGFYWDDKDGDINLRRSDMKPHNGEDLAGWVDTCYGEPHLFEVRYCHNEHPSEWPNVVTETREQAMNWLVAAVILDIRKE